MPSDTELAARLTSLARAYDSQGWHRTGTEASRASARWLADEMRARGVEPAFETLAIDRVEPVRCLIETDGRQIEGLPLFDCTFTGPEGVSGRLGPPGDERAAIHLIEHVGWGRPERAAHNRKLAALRMDPDARPIVAVTLGPAPGLAASNAAKFESPFGPPVLQVDSTHREFLGTCARRGAEATLIAEIRRVRSEDYTVVADVPGARADLPPVVVMTPLGAWFECTAERLGGIACWLEMLQVVRATGPKRSFRFIATTGHEIGNLGIRKYLDAHGDLVARARAWVHLGASIGAAIRPALELCASDRELMDVGSTALDAELVTGIRQGEPGRGAGGESGQIRARGGRYLSLAGSHGLVHLPADRWPDAIDIEALARFARAFSRIAIALGGE